MTKVAENLKPNIMSEVVRDADGSDRKKLNQKGEEIRSLTVRDVLADAVFRMDTTRLLTSKEDYDTVLIDKMKFHYDLHTTILDDTKDFTQMQKDALKGYLLGLQGSDVVKQQCLTALELLPVIAA